MTCKSKLLTVAALAALALTPSCTSGKNAIELGAEAADAASAGGGGGASGPSGAGGANAAGGAGGAAAALDARPAPAATEDAGRAGADASAGGARQTVCRKLAGGWCDLLVRCASPAQQGPATLLGLYGGSDGCVATFEGACLGARVWPTIAQCTARPEVDVPRGDACLADLRQAERARSCDLLARPLAGEPGCREACAPAQGGGGAPDGGVDARGGSDAPRGADGPAPSGSFRLTSAAFEDTFRTPARHTLDGENLSPPLAWTGAPAGTQSFAVVLQDVPAGTVRWVLWDLPPTVTTLPEGIARASSPPVPAGAKQNAGNHVGYRGPGLRPGGTGEFAFRVFALNVATLGLAAGAGEREAYLAVTSSARVLGSAGLLTSHARPALAPVEEFCAGAAGTARMTLLDCGSTRPVEEAAAISCPEAHLQCAAYMKNQEFASACHWGDRALRAGCAR